MITAGIDDAAQAVRAYLRGGGTVAGLLAAADALRLDGQADVAALMVRLGAEVVMGPRPNEETRP